jgi:hypothetical protein
MYVHAISHFHARKYTHMHYSYSDLVHVDDWLSLEELKTAICAAALTPATVTNGTGERVARVWCMKMRET